jgi:NADH-quinone oxidoreductase subunit K
MIVPFSHILVLCGALFVAGVYALVARRNLIMVLLGLEIMLNASAIAFVGAALRWQSMDGQALAIFIMAVAATEVSIGLALVVSFYRRSGSVDPERLERS